jgi:hypothetical protein
MSGTKRSGVRWYFTWACVVLVCLGAPPLCAAQQSTPATQSAPTAHPSDFSDWLAFLAAATAGGGFDTGSPREPSVYGGIKAGLGALVLPPNRGDRQERIRTLTLDIGYDRVRSYNGFTAELSVMLPIVRFPKPPIDERRNYLRIYGEPGLGYRFGGGTFGGYASAKVMLVLLSDKRLTREPLRPSPFIVIQRRFSIPSMSRGDIRVVMGLMVAICNHCGLD